MNPNLIISSAFLKSELRETQYIDSFNLVSKIKNKFSSINIIETISKEPVQYLENSGFKVYYSELNNPYNNKGTNWVFHIENYLNKSSTLPSDVYVFLAGRYKIINENIFNLIEEYINKGPYNMLAKHDGIYHTENSPGVHTFYFSFRKFKFIDFSNWYKKNGNFEIPVEHEMKRYMDTQYDCLIMDKKIKLGLEALVWGDGKKFDC